MLEILIGVQQNDLLADTLIDEIRKIVPSAKIGWDKNLLFDNLHSGGYLPEVVQICEKYNIKWRLWA